MNIPKMIEESNLGLSQSPGDGRSHLACIPYTGDDVIDPSPGAFASSRNRFFNHFRYIPWDKAKLFMLKSAWILAFTVTTAGFTANQTDTVSAPLSESGLPFRVRVEVADFSLPAGLHSFVFGTYKGQWLLIAGRTNGLHDVDSTSAIPNSFPVIAQNKMIYVIDPASRTSYSRALDDSGSGLSASQIEVIAVTNALFCQPSGSDTLYMVGGYGIDSSTGAMNTKAALTAIDIPQMIKWVKREKKSKSLAKCIRQTFHPLLQVTGGVMCQDNAHQPFLVAFGQNYDGNYIVGLDGSYSRQIRPFQIIDTGRDLLVQPLHMPQPLFTYRRRDLNVVPIMKKEGRGIRSAFAALSGVFFPGDNDNPGAWTVPIEINADGSSRTFDPNDPLTLRQGMNNYASPTIGFFSENTNDMYTVLFGGFSYQILSNGDSDNQCTAINPVPGNVLTPCVNLPFVNDITTIRINSQGQYSQYLMSAKFPTIVPNFGTTPGNQTWFGSSAAFIFADNIPTYPNEVVAFDKIKKNHTFLGYIVGGIASSVTDTNLPTDSIASPYIFNVFLESP